MMFVHRDFNPTDLEAWEILVDSAVLETSKMIEISLRGDQAKRQIQVAGQSHWLNGLTMVVRIGALSPYTGSNVLLSVGQQFGTILTERFCDKVKQRFDGPIR